MEIESFLILLYLFNKGYITSFRVTKERIYVTIKK